MATDTLSTETEPGKAVVHDTVFSVLLAISFCHLLNDMMQSLLPAIYPTLKDNLNLTFGQVGLMTFVYQITASLLQPLIGHYSDKRSTPMALPIGTLFSLSGLLVLSVAHVYPMLLLGACLLGMGSSVFHPEGSRVARMASGRRRGLAQSMFQVGGNFGSSLGPLAAALIVVRWGQGSLAFFALLALISCAILWNIALWYKHHGVPRMAPHHTAHEKQNVLPAGKVRRGISILLALMFSKFVYLASITSYFTFYLIHEFNVSVQSSQLHLFAFLVAAAVGTFLGGPIGDRIGRRYVIWFSILGVLPFTLLLPHVDLFWVGPLSMIIGLLLASAFPAIVVYAQELVPGRIGMISGLFFGLAFGLGGLGAAVLGVLADRVGIDTVFEICAFLPAIGLVAGFLPHIGNDGRNARQPKSHDPQATPQSGAART